MNGSGWYQKRFCERWSCLLAKKYDFVLDLMQDVEVLGEELARCFEVRNDDLIAANSELFLSHVLLHRSKCNLSLRSNVTD